MVAHVKSAPDLQGMSLSLNLEIFESHLEMEEPSCLIQSLLQNVRRHFCVQELCDLQRSIRKASAINLYLLQLYVRFCYACSHTLAWRLRKVRIADLAL